MALVFTINSPVGWTSRAHDDCVPKTAEEDEQVQKRVNAVVRKTYQDPQVRKNLTEYNRVHYGDE